MRSQCQKAKIKSRKDQVKIVSNNKALSRI